MFGIFNTFVDWWVIGGQYSTFYHIQFVQLEMGQAMCLQIKIESKHHNCRPLLDVDTHGTFTGDNIAFVYIAIVGKIEL